MPYRIESAHAQNFERSSRAEWLLTNGIGGYAMGTVAGVNTRRYHGLLVAAVDPPARRQVLLANLDAFVEVQGARFGLSANQYPGTQYPQGYQYLQEVLIGDALVSRYRAAQAQIERIVAVHPGKNATTISFRNTGEVPCRLTLHPLVSHKFYHENFYESPQYPERIDFPPHRTAIVHGGVTLYLSHPGALRVPIQGWYYRFEHLREIDRGLDPRDDLFCPCELRYELNAGERVVLVASTEPDVTPHEPPLPTPDHSRLAPLLREAVGRFVIQSPGRASIIAGYPWFADWGRDTMISLPGVLLHTGRVAEARQLLLDYAQHLKNGLIPNRFTEHGGSEYNTVDATLWFANAVHKTLESEWNQAFAVRAFLALETIFEHHREGTLFGIRMDPGDGLLTQGEQGTQLTWMDAKVGDWVVTPRHGKPVEINGLWINFLRVAESLAERLSRPSLEYREAAEKAEANFQRRFFSAKLGYYLDTIDPDDASLRPNQVIPMALPFPAAKGEPARTALDVVTRELLTPFGLRTLAPHDANYHGRFSGPLRELDAAYHQGTAWPWLLGPYVTALVRLTGDRMEAKRILRYSREMLLDYGVGGIAEVYDGDAPQNPGGCPFQAWSAAEILRAWVEDVEGD